jgi:hypothetical protein
VNRIRIAETVTRKRVVEIESTDASLVTRLIARLFPRLLGPASPRNSGWRKVGGQWVRDQIPDQLAASIMADRSRVRARSFD